MTTPTPALPEEYVTLADAFGDAHWYGLGMQQARAALDAYVAGLIASPRSGAGEPEPAELERAVRAVFARVAGTDSTGSPVVQLSDPVDVLTEIEDHICDLTARLREMVTVADEYAAELQRVAQECGTPEGWQSAAQMVRAHMATLDEATAAWEVMGRALAAAPVPLPGAPTPELAVTRFEVIDHRPGGGGRVFTAQPCEIELSYQDNGRTLKVFIGPPTPEDRATSEDAS